MVLLAGWTALQWHEVKSEYLWSNNILDKNFQQRRFKPDLEWNLWSSWSVTAFQRIFRGPWWTTINKPACLRGSRFSYHDQLSLRILWKIEVKRDLSSSYLRIWSWVHNPWTPQKVWFSWKAFNSERDHQRPQRFSKNRQAHFWVLWNHPWRTAWQRRRQVTRVGYQKLDWCASIRNFLRGEHYRRSRLLDHVKWDL